MTESPMLMTERPIARQRTSLERATVPGTGDSEDAIRCHGAPSAQYPICEGVVSFMVQLSVKPVASRLVKSASASTGELFILMNALLVLSMASTVVGETLFDEAKAELPSCVPSLAPMP